MQDLFFYISIISRSSIYTETLFFFNCGNKTFKLISSQVCPHDFYPQRLSPLVIWDSTSVLNAKKKATFHFNPGKSPVGGKMEAVIPPHGRERGSTTPQLPGGLTPPKALPKPRRDVSGGGDGRNEACVVFFRFSGRKGAAGRKRPK